MGENKLIGMLFIGAAIGFYLPALPEPLIKSRLSKFIIIGEAKIKGKAGLK